MNDRSLSQLTADLREGSPEQRQAACQRLAGLGAGASPAAVALVAATADPELLAWAAEALENLGPPPAETVDDLRRLLAQDSSDVAYWAATLLGRQGSAASAVPDLVQTLEDSPHASVRQRAAWALGELGPLARSAGDALELAAGSSDARLARLAQAALERVRG